MKRLIIAGASGHGKVIADIAVATGYEEIVFLDDNEEIQECAGFPVVGKVAELKNMEGDKFVAIGNPVVRERIQSQINAITLIHPMAVISRNVTIGEGSAVMAGAVINSDAVLGKGCIVNTCASIDHDCVIEDYVHVSVGAHLCGTVRVGKLTWVGAGAIVNNNVNICEGCMIGSGSVVVSNIEEKGTYVGIPAHRK